MKLPLLFYFRQLVCGAGFEADVSMNGWALLEETSDRDVRNSWISGVAPAGISGGGANRSAAYLEFRNAWVSVLFDIAAESTCFDDFKVACQSFLDAQVPHVTQEWSDALAEVRRTNFVDPQLPRRTVVPVGSRIIDLSTQHSGAANNIIEPGLMAAA